MGLQYLGVYNRTSSLALRQAKFYLPLQATAAGQYHLLRCQSRRAVVDEGVEEGDLVYYGTPEVEERAPEKRYVYTLPQYLEEKSKIFVSKTLNS